jgi:hypothetical protein
MQIARTPQRRDDSLDITVSGDVLTLNNCVFDFSDLQEGERIQQADVDCVWLASDVTRLGGEICLTLIDPQAVG